VIEGDETRCEDRDARGELAILDGPDERRLSVETVTHP
jgi:hypothetical protein